MFSVEDHGSLVLVRPLTDDVEEWLQENTPRTRSGGQERSLSSLATSCRSWTGCSQRDSPCSSAAISVNQQGGEAL